MFFICLHLHWSYFELHWGAVCIWLFDFHWIDTVPQCDLLSLFWILLKFASIDSGNRLSGNLLEHDLFSLVVIAASQKAAIARCAIDLPHIHCCALEVNLQLPNSVACHSQPDRSIFSRLNCDRLMATNFSSSPKWLSNFKFQFIVKKLFAFDHAMKTLTFRLSFDIKTCLLSLFWFKSFQICHVFIIVSFYIFYFLKP